MTFLSHQAVVLPLKLAAPRWTNGTALVLGSMAPDVEYFFRGYPTSTISHTWLGQVTFCLPVTVVLYLLVTLVIARPVAEHLPAGGALNLREYTLLSEQPLGFRRCVLVVVSALIGSSSHVLLDGFTDFFGVKPYHDMHASIGWVAVNMIMWIALAVISVVLLVRIGRRRLLRLWAIQDGRIEGDPAGGGVHGLGARTFGSESTDWPPNAGAFWGWVLFSTLAGAAFGVYYRLPGFFLHQGPTWVHIWLCSVSGGFLGLLTASLFSNARRSQALSLRRGMQ